MKCSIKKLQVGALVLFAVAFFTLQACGTTSSDDSGDNDQRGRLDIGFEPVTVEREAEEVQGAFSVTADFAAAEVPVAVHARFYEVHWDAGVRQYTESFIDEQDVWTGELALSEESQRITFSMPLPGGHTDGTYKVYFELELDVNAHISTSGTEDYFALYSPAEVAPGDPFTIAVVADNQYLSRDYPHIYMRQYEWLAANAREQGIVLHLHLGDITQNNVHEQWQVARESIRLTDGIVPYVLSVGNHDMGPQGDATTRETYFNEYFPVARYEGLPQFGGVFEAGGFENFENSYHVFTFGNDDFLVLSLEFLPRDVVLAWADGVLSAYPDHRAIVITHTYTSRGRRATEPGSRVVAGDMREQGYGIMFNGESLFNMGEDIWEQLLRRHPNVFMVWSGHLHHPGMPRQVGIGDQGNAVYEVLKNFQQWETAGGGLLALVRFYPDNERIGVAAYSPYYETFYSLQPTGDGEPFEMDPDFFGDLREGSEAIHGFEVPFCIDLVEEAFVSADEACAIAW